MRRCAAAGCAQRQDSIGTFIADLVLQILSFVAHSERKYQKAAGGRNCGSQKQRSKIWPERRRIILSKCIKIGAIK